MLSTEQEPITASALGRKVGRGYATVVGDINKGILPAKWTGTSWLILPDDARKYIQLRAAIARSISISEFCRRSGQDAYNREIMEAVKTGELPTFRFTNRRSSAYYILETDARDYCQRMGWSYTAPSRDQSNGYQQEVPSDCEQRRPVASHQCGVCGTTKGNIVGDVDRMTGERYGFLCMKCYPLVRDLAKEPARIQGVYDYVVKTRLSHIE